MKDYASREHRLGRYAWIAIAASILAITVAAGTLILRGYVNANTTSIKRLQEHDRAQSRAVDRALIEANHLQDVAIRAGREAEYRICVRQMIVRAAINADHDADIPHLPLYDCHPNLTGGRARQLTPKQQRRMAARIRKAHYTP